MIHTGCLDAKPEDVGFDPLKVDMLDAWFLETIEAGHLQAASYVLSRHGKVFAHKSMGALCGIEPKGDFLPDSLYGIASATKPFTAAAIMQLVEQGKIALEQPVSMILDEFNTPLHQKISVFHLLTHTSGLASDPGSHAEPYPRASWEQGLDKTNWIPFVLKGPLQFPVGEVWNYCSHGFMILGEIIARVSGMTYAQYMQEYVLEPLEMTHSFFDIPDAHRENVCIVTDDDKESLDRPRQPGFVSSWVACGDLYSTPYDLWKFGQMLLNKGNFRGKRILGRKMVEAMTRNHLHGIPAYNWGVHIKEKPFGLGCEVDKEPIFSPGTITHEGYGWTSFLADPIEQLVCVFVTPGKVDWWEAKPMCARSIVLAGIL
jgi:CubicO group peptidase (beta-lactamase class C family)